MKLFVPNLAGVHLIMLALVFLAEQTMPLAAAPKVDIVAGKAEGEIARLRCAGVSEPMILQSSADMSTWTDVALITPSFNEVEAGIPTGAPTGRSFYRLRTLREPLRLYPNTFPGSPHLAEIVSGRDVEINLFGTRTAEGYPSTVTSISYRVGSTFYVNTSSDAAATPPSQQEQADKLDAPSASGPEGLVYVKGWVHVDMSSCRPTNSQPVVQYQASDGNRLISGEVKCELQSFTSTEAWYEYTVPYMFYSPPASRNEAELRSAHDDLLLFNIASAAPAMTTMLGAAQAASATGSVLEMPHADLAAITAGLLGHAGYDLVNSPSDYKTLSASLTATQLKLTAMLPNGDTHYLAKSPTITVTNPHFAQSGPTLTLANLCNQRLAFEPIVRTQNQDFLRNDFQYYNNARTSLFRRVDFLKYINAGGSQSRGDGLFSRANASSTVSGALSTGLISFSSETLTSVMEPDVDAVVTSDGKLTFGVIQGDGSSGIPVYAEFYLWGNTAQGRLTEGAQTLHAPLTTGRWVVQMYTGGVYTLNYLQQVSTKSYSEHNYIPLKGQLSLTLLGHTRPRGWSETFTGP